MRAEQDKETSGVHLAMMTSMSGFKLEVSFLFNSATEAMATATRRAREVTVLSLLWTIQPSKSLHILDLIMFRVVLLLFRPKNDQVVL